MCHYISLVTNGITLRQVDVVLRSNRRRARLADVQSLQNVMMPSEIQFTTCVGDCDCGTVLTHQSDTAEWDAVAQVRKYLAKGWTQQKAERAVKAKLESALNSPTRSVDNYELWQNIIDQLLSLPDCREVGIMLHFYSGSMTNEAFVCLRKPIKKTSLNDELKKLPEDTLLIISH